MDPQEKEVGNGGRSVPEGAPATEATSDRGSATGTPAAGRGHSPGASGSASAPAGRAARSARGTGSWRCPPCGAASPRSPAGPRRDAREPSPAPAGQPRSSTGEAGRRSPGKGLSTWSGARTPSRAEGDAGGWQAALEPGLSPEDCRATCKRGAGRPLRARWSRKGPAPNPPPPQALRGCRPAAAGGARADPGCRGQRPHQPGTTSWPRCQEGLTPGSRGHCPLLGTCTAPHPQEHGRRAGRSRAPP